MKYNVNDFELNDYNKLNDLYKNAYSISCKPDPNKFPRYKEGAVIDEDKSVKWNKEEIVKRNKAYQDEVARLNKIRNNAIFEIDKLIKCLIIDDLKFFIPDKSNDWYENAAKHIFQNAYDRGHSYGMYDVICYINDNIDFVTKIVAFG